uniref:copper resistance D family protein n=1 Tax=Galactobacter sp. TaxID=2676125 RepID=UPI0025BBF421
MSALGQDHRRTVARWVTLPAVPVALAVLVLGLWLAGSAGSSVLGDPGAMTRWGLPIARLVFDSCMAVTVGCLLFATAILPRSTAPRRGGPGDHGTDGGDPQPALIRVVNAASVSAGIWTVSAAAMAVFSYSDAAAIPINVSTDFTQGLGDYLANFDQGRAWAAATIIAALTTTLAFALRSPAGLAWATVVAVIGIVPMALIGHSAGGDDHWGAVNSIGLHLLGICAWVGGLVALGLVAGLLPGRTPALTKAGRDESGYMAADVLSRFSTLAGCAILLVIGSGIASASIRVHDLDQLNTAYGWLLIAKFVLSLGLGVLGLVHRRWIIPKLRAGQVTARAAAWRVISVEVA